MGLFSGSGTVWDDAVTISTGGLVNQGAAKDKQKAQDKKDKKLGREANQLRQDGLAKGDAEFEKIYGTNKDQVGLDMKDIIQRRKDVLNQTQNDFGANQIRQSGNDAVRMANASAAQNGMKGGIGMQASNAVKREATKDVNQQLATKYMSDLNASQSMTGNLATQSQRLPQVYAQIFQGGQYIPPVGQAPFMGGMFDGGILGGVLG